MTAPRLLAINNYFYRRGGAESVFFDQIDLFEGIGWDVVPFAMQHPENAPSPWSQYFVSEIEYGRSSGFTSKLFQASKVIYSLEARQKLRALIEQAPPSIAHAHNVYHHLSPSIFEELRRAGIPVVMTAHDLKLACPAYKMLSDGVCERCKGGRIHNVVRRRCVKDSLAVSSLVFLETLVHRTLGLYSRCIDRLVTPSRFYRDKLVEWGWDASRIDYVPNTIDLGRFTPRAHEGDYFVFAGRLAPEKGVATLIRAAALARQRLVIVGTGPEESELRRIATEVDADVRFEGHCSGDTLHRLMGEAIALVLPSEWYENAPISILEAYALGRPVIGTSIGGIPELVMQQETGFLAAPSNVSNLADTLARMAALSSEQRSTLGAAGRTWVGQEFSRKAHLERLTAIYGAIGMKP